MQYSRTDNNLQAGTLQQQIRSGGKKIDSAMAESLYAPLLASQPKTGVKVISDLSYGTDLLQTLDLYLPEALPVRNPTTIVFFHGGGFIRGDKKERENIGYFLASRGLTVLIPNYRLAPKHRWPAGAEDVGAVLQWSQTHLNQFHLSASQIFLAGESAGAAHVATSALVSRFQRNKRQSIAGIILVSGVYNVQLERLAREQFGIGSPDVRNEGYFGSDVALYPRMSIVELIDVASFPVLITYAELDPLQMQVQACELFARLVVSHGFHPELTVIQGHNHLTQVYSVNTGDLSLMSPMLSFIESQGKTATDP